MFVIEKMGSTEVDTQIALPIQSSPPQKLQFHYYGNNLQANNTLNNNNNNIVSSSQNVVDAPIQPQQQNYAPAASSSASQRQLRSEALRLATFQGWPLEYLPPRELASAGFFYCGVSDQTRCAFCFITISQWEPEDDPAEEHRRHAPNCPFVLGLPVGNIPLSSVTGGSGRMSGGSAERSNSSTGQLPPSTPAALAAVPASPRPPFLLAPLSSVGGDTCTRFQNEMRPNAIPERAMAASTLSIRPPVSSSMGEGSSSSSSSADLSALRILPHQPARRPELTTLEARMNTFAEWPPGLEQRPAQLAEAGFYYMKTGDHVKCFCCDGALRNWEPKDDPWVEHARWFSRCNYLISVKGEDYIQEVKARYQQPQQLPLIATASTSSASTTATEDIVELKEKRPEGEVTPAKSPEASELKAAAEEEESRDEQSPKSKLRDALLCKICYERQLSMVFLPCGHSMSCPTCAMNLTNCPMCRKRIEATVRAYFPFAS